MPTTPNGMWSGWRVVMAAAALSVLLGFPGAAQANLSWSAPVGIDSGNALTAVACPSVSQCTAVGGLDELTFDPASPGTPTPATIDSGLPVIAVSCPSVSQCTAVGSGQVVTFDPGSPGTPTSTTICTECGLDGVACPSVRVCAAAVGIAGGSGEVAVFDPRSPGTTTRIVSGGLWFYGVACPSVSQCTAVGGGGAQPDEVTFDPTSPGTPTAFLIDRGNVFSHVACPSVTQCTALDFSGQQITFDPASPGTPTPTTIGSSDSLTGLACPSVSLCIAVDQSGREVTFDPASPGTPTPTIIDFGYGLNGIACPTVSQCTAVDSDGEELTGTAGGTLSAPVDVLPPSISGAAIQGETLTESHGTWSNSPTAFAYQWQKCDSTAIDCQAITGATGQTYTVSTNDVGSTIRVVETASNTAGAGSPAVSSATPSVQALAGNGQAGQAPTGNGQGGQAPGGNGPSGGTQPTAPNTHLVKEQIKSKEHSATFVFGATGDSTGFQCALVRKPTRKGVKTPSPKYSKCGASKTFKNLKAGKYEFCVHAIGPGGVDKSSATYNFRIS